QVRQADVRVQRDHHAVRPDARHLLVDDGGVEKVGARAAVLGRRAHPEEPLGAGTPPALAVAHATGVPLRDLRSDLLLDETTHLGPEELVILGEDVASHRSSYLDGRGRAAPSCRRPAAPRGRGDSRSRSKPPRKSRVTNAVAPSTSGGWRSTMRSATSTATPAIAAVREAMSTGGTTPRTTAG